MQEFTILGIIVIFVAGAFAMEWFRMHYITQQDVNLSKKVNGLSIDMGKLKKAVRERENTVQSETREVIEMPVDIQNMSLNDVAGYLGIEAEVLNNPIVKPMAEKIFNQLKEKAVKSERVGEEKVMGY